ncbi:CoA transferase [Acuticoccus sp.]|uniref:CoA transferase n=1 Tax=Acuticoccus sp. TaxID=1904378 RepID=UPI003B52DA15
MAPAGAVERVPAHLRREAASSPRNVYATSDGGWVAISASTQSMTERLFRAIGRDDLNSNPEFSTNAKRIQRRQEVDAIVGGWIGQRTLADNIAFFEEAGVTAAPVYNIGQFLDDAHVQERGIVVELPDEDMGRVPMHGIVPRMSRTPGVLRTPAPDLGAHNDEVYGSVGYSRKRVAELRARGVI